MKIGKNVTRDCHDCKTEKEDIKSHHTKNLTSLHRKNNLGTYIFLGQQTYGRN